MVWLCPLCEREVAGPTCAAHGVPAVDPARLDAPRPLISGTQLPGGWRLGPPLGEGGMAATFALTGDGGREAVLKLPHPRGRGLDLVRRLYQEARAIGALSHPSIVRLLGFGVHVDTGRPYLILERVPGVSLRERLRSAGPLPEARARQVTAALFSALAHAHDRGVLHRDLTPGNVMLGESSVHLLDFGLARMAGDEGVPPLTEPGKCVGTPGFMSPEQITGGVVGVESDLYGVGCLLHAMLAGQGPYPGSDALAVMQGHLRSPVPPLPERLVDGAPPSAGLARLHQALLAKSRLARPSTAAQARALLEEPAPAAPSPAPASPRPRVPAQPTLPEGELPGGPTLVAPRPLDAGDAPAPTPLTFGPVQAPASSRRRWGRWLSLALPSALGLGVLGWALWGDVPPRASPAPAGPRPAPPARPLPPPVVAGTSSGALRAAPGAHGAPGPRVAPAVSPHPDPTDRDGQRPAREAGAAVDPGQSASEVERRGGARVTEGAGGPGRRSGAPRAGGAPAGRRPADAGLTEPEIPLW